MKRRGWMVVAALVSVLHVGCGGSSSAQPQETAGPATHARTRSLVDILGPLGAHRSPAQLAEIADFIRRWERDPYAPVPENTTEHSTQFLVLAWLTESPDVTVVASPVLSQLVEGRGADVGPVATVGSMFGMAAYLAEHPGVDGRDPEVQAAGVASALSWYEASLRRGGGRNELLDELVAIREQSGVAGLREWWTARVRFTD